jgi:alkanesulfonate monooxygenase SsuD/methylene tetrahydromethanopterin reductase-like flavin-dependent oxidoreductase (luciferase family)
LPYAFADFISPHGATIAADYRKTFAKDGYSAESRVIVASTVICAETDEEARRQAASSRMLFTMMQEGKLIAVPSVETATRFFAERGLPPDAIPRGRRAIIGSPETVRLGIEKLAAEYGADEVMIVTITYDHEVRRRSYELIARTFALAESREGHDERVGATISP